MSELILDLRSETPTKKCSVYGCLENTYNPNGICDSLHFWTGCCKKCYTTYIFRYTPGIDYTHCEDCRTKPSIIKRLFSYLFNISH